MSGTIRVDPRQRRRLGRRRFAGIGIYTYPIATFQLRPTPAGTSDPAFS